MSICCACRYVTGPAEEHEAESLPPIAGLALLCAAPATGNNELVKRVARKSLVKAAKMTWCAAAKGWEAFHEQDLARVRRYHNAMHALGQH